MGGLVSPSTPVLPRMCRNQQALAEVWEEVRALKALQKETQLPESDLFAETKALLVRWPAGCTDHEL